MYPNILMYTNEAIKTCDDVIFFDHSINELQQRITSCCRSRNKAATFPVWMQGHSDPYDVGSQPVKEKNKNNRTRACATRLEIL